MDQAGSSKKDESPPKKPSPPPPSAADEVTLIGTPAPRPAGAPARPGAGSPGVPVRAPGGIAGRGTTVALPRRGTSVPVPPPTPPVTTNLPAELLTLIDPDLTTQDLTRDKLLETAPRAQVGSKLSPLVGIIPLFVKLGQGGLGAVYYGIHPTERVGVAVKIVPVAAANTETIQRFYNEVRVAATIKSPHLVPIKDLGEQKGLYYVITDFIPGTPAAAYLRSAREGGATGIPELEALDMVIGAVTGLAEAHKNGMIHGDFRPENILIPKSKDGQLLLKEARLADLGLPRMEELGGVLSGSNAAIGTPGYMAPEQAVDAKAARKPSDIFSAGATLYTLLAGQPPFPIDNPMTAIMHTIQTPHDPVTKHRKEVSPATAELLDRCLAKKPSERYVDGSALLEALKVCHEALTQPQMTQRTAIKRITLVLQKSSEVGQKVLGTESGTPSSLPFLAELAAAPEAARKKAAAAAAAAPVMTASEPTMITAAPVFAATPGKKRDTAPLQVPPQPVAVAASAPAGSASRESAAMPVPAPASSFMTKVVIAAAAVIVGIVVLVVVLHTSGPTADQAEAHTIFLKSAREAAIKDRDAAKSLLEQARKLKIGGRDWQRKEEAVEQLIEASHLFRTSADPAAIGKMLDAVEKVYPGDATVNEMRQKIRQRRDNE